MNDAETTLKCISPSHWFNFYFSPSNWNLPSLNSYFTKVLLSLASRYSFDLVFYSSWIYLIKDMLELANFYCLFSSLAYSISGVVSFLFIGFYSFLGTLKTNLLAGNREGVSKFLSSRPFIESRTTFLLRRLGFIKIYIIDKTVNY